MNKTQLMKKLLKQREQDHQKAEFLEKRVGSNAQNGAYNTPSVLYVKVTCKLYRAGRTYLVRIPLLVVRELKLQPADFVTITIEKTKEGE